MKIKKGSQLIGVIGLLGVLLTPNVVVIAQGIVNERDFKKGEKLELGEPPAPLTKEQIDEISKNPPKEPPYQSGLEAGGVKMGALGNCMDTFKYGGIKIDITQNKNNYESGDTIQLRGIIKNENPYPLIGLTVSARLVKNIPNANDQAYTQTIDEFIIAENVNIVANGKIDVQQLRLLGLQAPKGDYEILFFAYQQDRFTHSGLSFTDDAYGSRVTFAVGGNNTEQVYLDQTRTTVGDKKNINHGFTTSHEKGSKVQVKIPLKNNTDTVQDMEFTSQLYSWDGLRKEALQKEEKETIAVPAKGEVLITRTVEKAELPVYYLKLTATKAGDIAPTQQYTSISNIRFVVSDADAVRFNWVGLNNFPKVSGSDAKVVTCIHNTSNGIAKDIEVETKVLDTKGKEVSKSLYKGVVSGQVDAIIADLPKNKTYNTLTIISTIKDGSGNIIDTVNIPYDCKNIDASTCGKESVLDGIVGNILGIIGLIVIIGVAIYTIYLQRKTIAKLIKK